MGFPAQSSLLSLPSLISLWGVTFLTIGRGGVVASLALGWALALASFTIAKMERKSATEGWGKVSFFSIYFFAAFLRFIPYIPSSLWSLRMFAFLVFEGRTLKRTDVLEPYAKLWSQKRENHTNYAKLTKHDNSTLLVFAKRLLAKRLYVALLSYRFGLT